MKAINLLSDNLIEVKEFKGVFYYETNDDSLPFGVLLPSDHNENDIDEYHLYSFYRLNNKIYEVIYTTDYKIFIEQTKQTTIFDFI